MSLKEVTIADRLRKSGYRTGLIGKWHLGAGRSAFMPTARGFDEFVGFLGGLSDYWDYDLIEGERRVAGSGQYLTDVLTDHAVEFVEQHQDRPFFLEVAYNAPHEPLQAPEEFLSLYSDAPVSQELKTLYAMVSAMDHGIGRLLDSLDDRGLASNTLLIFTSDNGPDFAGGPQLMTVDPALVRFNAGLRGHKGLVHEGGVRVPCFVRWPDGGVREGVSYDRVTQFIDWVPTLLEAAGLTPEDDIELGPSIDGSSILGALLGSVPQEADAPFMTQWNRYEPVPRCNASITRGGWKLVWPALESAMYALPEDSAADRALHRSGEYPQPLEYNAGVERNVSLAPTGALLFDLADDPAETNDVSANYPDIVAALVRELDAWFVEMEHERMGVVQAGLCT